MKHLTIALLCVGVAMTTVPTPTLAGTGVIERACRQSNRTAANPSLCRCIQKVANKSLSHSERRKVSKWFSDPHRAQEVRQSDNRSDERLWLKYKAFGQQAQKTCG
ncbi:hypothetical protein QEZ52_08690 [Aliisedimentitalea scapharcae]|uniref:Uncharacterized protein n=1 Tax=Aliisedimentitalea scapharcae TaxID=1524259 RepID=A0ABZ2XWX0_9RHOB